MAQRWPDGGGTGVRSCHAIWDHQPATEPGHVVSAISAFEVVGSSWVPRARLMPDGCNHRRSGKTHEELAGPMPPPRRGHRLDKPSFQTKCAPGSGSTPGLRLACPRTRTNDLLLAAARAYGASRVLSHDGRLLDVNSWNAITVLEPCAIPDGPLESRLRQRQLVITTHPVHCIHHTPLTKC